MTIIQCKILMAVGCCAQMKTFHEHFTLAELSDEGTELLKYEYDFMIAYFGCWNWICCCLLLWPHTHTHTCAWSTHFWIYMCMWLFSENSILTVGDKNILILREWISTYNRWIVARLPIVKVLWISPSGGASICIPLCSHNVSTLISFIDAPLAPLRSGFAAWLTDAKSCYK